MNVNNGQRVAVDMPGFQGTAGIVRRGDVDEISFPARLRSLPVSAGGQITVESQTRRVLSVTTSPFLPGFVVMQITKQES